MHAKDKPNHEPDLAGDDAELLTVPELAAVLRLNRKTVYAAIAAGEIHGRRPHSRPYPDPPCHGATLDPHLKCRLAFSGVIR